MNGHHPDKVEDPAVERLDTYVRADFCWIAVDSNYMQLIGRSEFIDWIKYSGYEPFPSDGTTITLIARILDVVQWSAALAAPHHLRLSTLTVCVSAYCVEITVLMLDRSSGVERRRNRTTGVSKLVKAIVVLLQQLYIYNGTMLKNSCGFYQLSME